MKKIIIFIIIVLLYGSSCTTYFSPDRYANPRHKFESGGKKYERKLRRLERRNTPTIDPLRWHH